MKCSFAGETVAIRRFTENQFMSQLSPLLWKGGAVFLRLLNFFPSPVSVPKPKVFLVCGKIDRQRGVLLEMLQFRRETRDAYAAEAGCVTRCTAFFRARRRGLRPHRRPAPMCACPCRIPTTDLSRASDCAAACGARGRLCSSLYLSTLDKTRLPEIDAIRWGKIGSSPQNQKFCIHWPLPGQLPPSHERL
jgi:hypothetical protein